MAREFTPEEAVQVAKQAGLDTSELEAQVARRADSGPDDLAAKLDRVEQALQRSQPPATREQQDQELGRAMLEHLNRSTSKWTEFNEIGARRG